MDKFLMDFNRVISLFWLFSALFFSVSRIFTRLMSVAQTRRLLTILWSILFILQIQRTRLIRRFHQRIWDSQWLRRVWTQACPEPFLLAGEWNIPIALDKSDTVPRSVLIGGYLNENYNKFKKCTAGGMASLVAPVVNLPAKAGDVGLITGSGRSGAGNGNPHTSILA